MWMSLFFIKELLLELNHEISVELHILCSLLPLPHYVYSQGTNFLWKTDEGPVLLQVVP